jgi:hypothetical protein
VATITNYDENNQGSSTQYYVADFDIIQNIDINENGYLIFTTNGKTISSTNAILPILDEINLSNDGELSMEWHNANEANSKKTVLNNEIKWIKNIDVKDGNFYVTWNIPERDEDNNIINDNKKEEISIKNTKLITDLKIIEGSLC